MQQTYEIAPDVYRLSAQTGSQLESVANLNPATLAVMHGSSYSGDGRKAIRQLSVVFRDVLGEPSAAAAD